MKRNLLLLLTFTMACYIQAQTKVTVSVAGTAFTPANVTINVGDTVEWINTSGTHNVNGTQATYASNPENFGNSLGSGWTYSHVFTTAGVNDYRCDAHFNFGMTGTVTVQTPSSVSELDANKNALFFPNPSNGTLHFPNVRTIRSVAIYNMAGEKVLAENLPTNYLTVGHLSKGVYLIRITTNDTEIHSQKLLIN
ncbi:MAG: T9SS type A sorting domain-containing protein [Flavobacteriales bacterium]|nr:T9SS type A sorting domain-containing protein [Flavobacteriales bacterium]